MAYGTIKVDNITFTNGGVDQTISVSGVAQSISGDITTTGTIQGATIIGTSTVSGATVTGNAGVFTTVTGGSAGFTTVTGTTVTGTTANFNAGTFTSQVSGATVTGNLAQFATLTGGTAGFTTITGATVTGTTANFVTVSGTTVTGNAGQFTTITGTSAGFTTITGATVTGTVGNFGSGSAAAPAVSVGTTDNGLYSPGTDQVALSTNGTGRLFVDASGNITINGQGGLRFADADSSNWVAFQAPATVASNVTWTLPSADGTSGQVLSTDGAGALSWATAAGGATDKIEEGNTSAEVIDTGSDGRFVVTTEGVEALRVDSSQRVGIGTTSPGVALHVDGDIRADGIYGETDTNTSIQFPGSDVITFNEGGSEAARIDSSGRLLVGTSTSRSTFSGSITSNIQVEFGGNGFGPGFSLYGNSSTTTRSPILTLGKSGGNTVGSFTLAPANEPIGRIHFEGADGTASLVAASIIAEVDGTPGANDMPGRLVFSVTADGSASPSEAMRINNAGELLVGYTSDNGAYKLQVNSQIFATSAIIATSDGRYKENVAALDGCVDLVKALRPVSFDWKAQEPVTRVDEDGETVVVREAHNFPDGKQVGFIAQEVEEVLADKPWLGSVIKQNVRPAVTDADGNELAPEEEFLGIAEGNLVAVLTSALKDAIGRIESLEAEVAALKA